MFYPFINKQWKTSFFIVLLFLIFMLIYNNISNSFAERYINEQKNYIIFQEKHSNQDFFQMLDNDLKKARDAVSVIENYEGYDSEIIFQKVDPILVAANANNYATYDMIVWKEEMLNMPGRWTDTIENDYYMLAQLSERMNNQKNFEINHTNNLELLERGMRRNDFNFYKYKATYEQTKKIYKEFSFSDTIVIEKIVNFIEKDYLIIVLFALLYFSVFSNASQLGMIKQIYISSKGMRCYTALQCCSICFLTLLCSIIYYSGIVLILSNGNLDYLLWEMPVQAINGYENISYALTFKDFLMNSFLIKLFHSLIFSLLILLASLISRNNIMSVVICALLCCGIIIPISSLDNNDLTNTILLGGSKFLFSDLPYAKFFGQIIPYNICYITIAFVAIIIIFSIIVYLSKFVAKWWVK